MRVMILEKHQVEISEEPAEQFDNHKPHVHSPAGDPIMRKQLLQIERLVYRLRDEGLVEIQNICSGTSISLSEQAYFGSDDWFATFAGVPTAVAVALVAILWVISPVDLMPDSLPFGTVDDVGVSLLAAKIVSDAF
jgi:Protein of unknown function (DUF1232)